MIALPFVYFLIWFIYAFKKRGLDVFSFILLLYTTTSFFSILLDFFNYYSNDSCPKMPTLGVVAPILYIALLTICIHPFSKFNSNAIERIGGKINENRFNLIVYVYFVMFLIVLVVSATRLQEIIMSNTFADIRGEFYHGESVSFYNHLSGISRIICSFCYVLSPTSLIMIPFFFIGIVRFHKGFFFNLMTLCASLTRILIAINIADRSNFVYWSIAFILCFILFRPQLSHKSKRQFAFFFILLSTLMLTYFLSVTISRYENSTVSSEQGLILYAGQSYINFCNFFNYLIFEAPHRLEVVLFPNINKYILNGPDYFTFTEQLRRIYHHTVSNFSSFIGLIMSVSGLPVTIIYCMVFNYVSRRAIWRPKKKEITWKRFVFFWIVILNPALGLFGYYYMSAYIVMGVVVWLLLIPFLTTDNLCSSYI